METALSQVNDLKETMNVEKKVKESKKNKSLYSDIKVIDVTCSADMESVSKLLLIGYEIICKIKTYITVGKKIKLKKKQKLSIVKKKIMNEHLEKKYRRLCVAQDIADLLKYKDVSYDAFNDELKNYIDNKEYLIKSAIVISKDVYFFLKFHGYDKYIRIGAFEKTTNIHILELFP